MTHKWWLIADDSLGTNYRIEFEKSDEALKFFKESIENPKKGIKLQLDTTRINHFKHVSAGEAKIMIQNGELIQGIFKVNFYRLF